MAGTEVDGGCDAYIAAARKRSESAAIEKSPTSSGPSSFLGILLSTTCCGGGARLCAFFVYIDVGEIELLKTANGVSCS